MKTFPLLIAMMGLALIIVGGVCFVAITLLMLAGLVVWHSVSGVR